MRKIYDGTTLLCRADHEGSAIPGRISFTPEGVHVKLVGFEKYIHMDSGGIIPLQLEDNQYCTASSSSTSQGSLSSANSTCYYIEFTARQAIIGFRPWRTDDRIKEFHFRLSNTNGLLEAPDIRRKIAASKFGDQPDTRIFESSSGGVTVTISYSYTIDGHDQKYSVSEPYGCVKFEEPQKPEDLSEFVAVLRTFFTMAAGIEVRTTGYVIFPYENEEQVLLGAGMAPAAFQLIWPIGKFEHIDEFDGHRPTSVLRCFDEANRRSTSTCLTFWMDNWIEWKPAFSGLWLARREGNKFDTNRILNACKWLESTPGARQQKVSNQHELRDISNAAIEKARALGLDLSDRISGAINQLGTESRNELFKRLIQLAVTKGDSKLKDRLLRDLHGAFAIRGRFAHSKFDHTSDEEFGDYVRCTKAVEALAFLLLFRNLPLPMNHHLDNGHNSFTDYFIIMN